MVREISRDSFSLSRFAKKIRSLKFAALSPSPNPFLAALSPSPNSSLGDCLRDSLDVGRETCSRDLFVSLRRLRRRFSTFNFDGDFQWRFRRRQDTTEIFDEDLDDFLSPSLDAGDGVLQVSFLMFFCNF